MTHPIYTIGYGGLTAPRVHQIVTALDAVLVDIRFAARSRVSAWNKGKLQELFGDRYVHLNSLGNAAYREGGMQIANYADGKAMIETLAMPVVLMCACKHPDDCHRSVVADMLRADGFEVSELTLPLILSSLDKAATPPQLSLFGTP